MRKLYLSALAFLLVLSAAVPSFASEATPLPEENPTLDDSELIKVDVPAVGQIVINPYGLPVEIGDETSMEQIASETLTMINKSNTPVVISASAVGSVSESSTLVYTTQPPQTDALEKEIFLYVEFQKEDGLWSGAYTDGANQILVSGQASEPKEVLSLDGESQGVFRLFGATSTYPKNAWNVEDKISVTVAFTFSPVADPEPALISDEEPVEPETSASEETPVPEETPALEETPVPEETPALEETPAPEETPALEESPEPEPSLEPESPAPESEPLPESDALPSETTSY